MISLLFLLLIISPQQITWYQSAPPSIAQIYIYRLYITEESGIKRIVTLSNIKCGQSDGDSQCSAALPPEGNAAIITGNISYLTAMDPNSMLESSPSISFVGDQGCIFRDNLYSIGARVNEQSNKQNMNSLLNEFQSAKFKHISTSPLKGNQYAVVEECVGYLVH